MCSLRLKRDHGDLRHDKIALEQQLKATVVKLETEKAQKLPPIRAQAGPLKKEHVKSQEQSPPSIPSRALTPTLAPARINPEPGPSQTSSQTNDSLGLIKRDYDSVSQHFTSRLIESFDISKAAVEELTSASHVPSVAAGEWDMNHNGDKSRDPLSRIRLIAADAS